MTVVHPTTPQSLVCADNPLLYSRSSSRSIDSTTLPASWRHQTQLPARPVLLAKEHQHSQEGDGGGWCTSGHDPPPNGQERKHVASIAIHRRNGTVAVPFKLVLPLAPTLPSHESARPARARKGRPYVSPPPARCPIPSARCPLESCR